MKKLNPWLIVSLLFAIAIIAYMALSIQTPKPAAEAPVPGGVVAPAWDFAPLEVDSPGIREARQRRAGVAASLTPEVAELQALWAAYRRYALASASGLLMRSPEAFERVHQELAAAIIDLNSRFGAEGYSRAGQMVYERMQQLMALRLERVPATLSPRAASRVSAVAMGRAWQQSLDTVAYLGDFLALAQSEGWLDESGQVAQERGPVVALLFSYLWAQLAAEVFSLDRLLSAEEVVAIRRWQLEQSAMPLEQKLAVIERVRGRLGSYDVARTEAILYRRAGKDAEAKAVLKRARDEALSRSDEAQAQVYRGMLDSL